MSFFSKIGKEFGRAVSKKNLSRTLMIGAALYTGYGLMAKAAAAAPVASTAASGVEVGSTGMQELAASQASNQTALQSAESAFASGSTPASVATGQAVSTASPQVSGGLIPKAQIAQGVSPQLAPEVQAPSGGFQTPQHEYAVNAPDMANAPNLAMKKEGAFSIGSFIKDNPMAAALALNTAAGAFSADEIDIMRERDKRSDRGNITGRTIRDYRRSNRRTA